VVGVILNLAVFFALHVFWPEGFPGRFDFFSALIGAAALLSLLRYKIGVIAVIVASGAAGLAVTIISTWAA
jgi:chromate transporter